MMQTLHHAWHGGQAWPRASAPQTRLGVCAADWQRRQWTARHHDTLHGQGVPFSYFVLPRWSDDSQLQR